jgi:DNA polymerase
MDGLLAADDAQYNGILSVHDEILTEPVDQEEFNQAGLSRLLTSSSLWADGLPLSAKGWEGLRYHK